MCGIAMGIDDSPSLGEEWVTRLPAQVAQEVVQYTKLETRLALDKAARRVEFHECQNQRAESKGSSVTRTCQANGRFFRLMMAKIRARVRHEASDVAADARSRMFSV